MSTDQFSIKLCNIPESWHSMLKKKMVTADFRKEKEIAN